MDRPGSGLRRLIGLLLVVNVGVLLVGWGGGLWQGRSPSLVTFNAEKISLLADTLPQRTGVAQAESTAEPRAESRAETPAGDLRQANCRAWAALDADGVAQVLAHMRQTGVADGAYDLRVAQRLGWWVYIPPLENPASLQVVMEDARAKGVGDMAAVRGGSMANALALGMFATLRGARQHARAMLDKGLRDVRFAPRPGAGPVQLVIVEDSPAVQWVLASGWPPGLQPGPCARQ